MSESNIQLCPHCASTLVERQAMPMPRRAWRKWLLAAACLLLAAIGLMLAQRHPATEPGKETTNEPPVRETDPYLAACQTYYTGADGQEYHVFAAFSPQGENDTTPVGYFSTLLLADQRDSRPATVFAVNAVTGESTPEAFAALLEDWDVTVTASGGSGHLPV